MEKQKKKIDFLWFNLFYCLAYAASVFIAINIVCAVKTDLSIVLTLFLYVIDVNHNSNEDYTKYRLGQLEEQINNKLKLKQDANI